jgi:hypothetical protein
VARESLCVSGILLLACLLGVASISAQSVGTLKGIVTHQKGLPVTDASLTLFSEDRVRNAKTDGKGQFKFASLPFQTYELQVSSTGFGTVTFRNLRIAGQEPKSLSITLRPWSTDDSSKSPDRTCLIRIEVVPGLTETVSYEMRTGKLSLVGAVGDAWRGGPLKSAKITLSKSGRNGIALSEVNSDDSGGFQFADLEPGKYTLRVSHEGYYEGPTVFMEFWVTRENTTRLGRIDLYPDNVQDLCGMAGEQPLINPKTIPPPKLVPPR